MNELHQNNDLRHKTTPAQRETVQNMHLDAYVGECIVETVVWLYRWLFGK